MADNSNSLSDLQGSEKTLLLERMQAIKLDKKRLETAAELSQDIIVVTDCQGTVEYVNDAFCRITGYSPAEIISKNMRLLKSGQHGLPFYQDLYQTLLSGQTWSGRFVNRRKDGSLYNEEAIIKPMRDDDGQLTNFVAVKRDVSQQVNLENQVKRAQKMEAVGQLAGGVAHEFNNLLMVIINCAEFVKGNLQISSEEHTDMEELLKASNRAAELTRQLLAFSSRQIMAPKVINLNRVIADMKDMLRPIIGETIRIDLKLNSCPGNLHADLAQFEQVVMNLAVNARDAMPKGGVLTISTENVTLEEKDRSIFTEPPEQIAGHYVKLSVSDTGGGMTQEVLDHIFEPFFTTKPVGSGSGLGLATVYGIIRQHGGLIRAQSTPSKGTIFDIYLPTVLEEKTAVQKPKNRLLATSGPQTILMAEDEHAVRRIAARILEGLGYQVIQAHSGDHALELAANHPGNIDLLFTDLVMPGMNGVTLAKTLQAQIPGLPIIYASGYSDDHLAMLGELEKGAILLKKPFTKDDIIKRVTAILGKN